MDSRPSVVVVGSCMTDMVAYVPTLPRPGETLHGTKFSIGFGGKGANQAVMAAKRGSCTALVAKLGSDVFGDNYLENLRNVGIDVSHVGRVDGASGVALITVDDAAENCITIVGGANNHLSETDVMNCSRDILTTARVLVMQMEVPLATNLTALKLTRQVGDGVTTIFNAAPATDSLPAELYGLVDIFCVNESEAEKLLGLESVRTVEEASLAASQLVNRGCRVGMVTLGPLGAVYQERGHDDVTHVPSPKVQAVDTTGAGDAFIGALASLIADDSNNSSFRDKVEGACKVAAVSVTRHGTQSSFPGLEEEI